MLDRKLVVVGHGRGATSFTNAWLNAQGIQTGHEMRGTDGVVDSGFSVPGYKTRKGAFAGVTDRDDFNFASKACVLRNPWKTIATYYTVEHPDAIWLHEPYVDLSPAKGDQMNAIALSVARWTRAGMAYADFSFKAEEIDTAFLAWLVKEGLLAETHAISVVPKNVVNHKPGRRQGKDEIVAQLFPEILAELTDFVREAGYE